MTTGLLFSATVKAQIAPSTSSTPAAAPTSLPGTLSPTTVNPSQLPGQLPGRGTPTPAQLRNAAGQAQQPGRGQAGQTQGQNTGRTQSQTSPTDRNGILQNQQSTADSDNNQQQSSQDSLEDGYETARRRERERNRRKLFGYELFNDPALATTFQPNLRIATPRNYVLGPDDQLNVTIYGYSANQFTLPVSPEGNVYFPDGGIGPVYVAGLTIEAAKARITERLSKIYVGLKTSSYGPKNTYLEVTLGNIRSIRVSVLGEAVKPGTYTLSSLSTAMNAIYQAGGPNEIGSFRTVNVIRNNRLVTTIDLYDYLLTGMLRNDIRLQDNDIIRFVTYKERVDVTGPLKRNFTFDMTPGETLEKLIYFAGGFSATAYKSRLKVTRLTDRERKVEDVTSTDYPTFVLRDGDAVAVESVLNRFENQVSITGAVYRPGAYSLDQNKTLKQLIANADGLKGDAFTGRINIIRTREDLALETLTLNLADIINGVQPDVPLQREDQVTITSKFDLAQQATVSIEGEVNKPIGEEPYASNMTVEDLLVRAGGLKESAATSQIEVVRRKKDVDRTSATAQIAEVIRLNVNRDLSISGDNTKFVLQPFDQVFVRRSANYVEQTYANVDGEVILPGQYAIRSKDQKISDMVALAGGLTPQAYVEGATLLRQVQLTATELAQRQKSVNELADDASKSVVQVDEVAPDTKESIGINLKRILDHPGSVEDMLVEAGDILRIPKRLETVRMQGEVQLPTTVKFRPGQTFQDYISQAGGFTPRSQRKHSYIVYANGSADRTRRFLFFKIYPRVQPGSEVIVPRRNTTPLTPQQLISSTTGIISSVFTLIIGVLAFRSIK